MDKTLETVFPTKWRRIYLEKKIEQLVQEINKEEYPGEAQDLLTNTLISQFQYIDLKHVHMDDHGITHIEGVEIINGKLNIETTHLYIKKRGNKFLDKLFKLFK